MPSLAQRYGQGLLSGLEIQERQRRMKEQDLTDEFMRERIEDMRFQRKTLLSQLKEKEKATEAQEKQQAIKSDITRYGIMGGPEALKELYLEPGARELGFTEDIEGALGLVPGLDWGEQMQRQRVEEKVEGAPGVRPWYETYLDPEEMRKVALEGGIGRSVAGRAGRKENMQETLRRLGSGDPLLQEWGDVQWMLSKGYTIDAENRRYDYTGKIPTTSSLVNLADKLEGQAFLLDVEKRVIVEDLAEQIRAMAEVQIERRSPGEKEKEKPPVKLPSSLVEELGDFETFDKWYDSLDESAQTDLDAEPETLKAIKNWYAIPR